MKSDRRAFIAIANCQSEQLEDRAMCTASVLPPGPAIAPWVAPLQSFDATEYAPSEISGSVFRDLNNSQTHDYADSVLAGARVTLSKVQNEPTASSQHVITNEDGTYRFADISPGDYRITFTPPSDAILARIAADSIAGEYAIAQADDAPTIDVSIPASGGMRWADTNLVVPDSSARLFLSSALGARNSLTVKLDGQPSAEFIEDKAPVAVAGANEITSNGTASIESATVIIINPLDGESEHLAVETAGTKTSAQYNVSNGVLYIVGTDSIDNYEQVLRSLTYENRSQDPNPAKRSIKIAVSNSGTTSRGALAFIKVQPVNDAPNLFPIAAQTAVIDQALSLLVAATDPDANDLLTFQLDPNHSPTSASIERIDNNSARIHWTPSDDDLPGPVRFRVLVIDDDSSPAADSEEFLASLER